MIASFLDKLLFWLLHTYSLDLFLLIFPIEQAPSLASRPDEFKEEESLVTPDALSARIGGFQIYAGSVNWGVFGSMKIVFLKSKLNVLIPCGFLAIFLNYMTQRYVGTPNFHLTITLLILSFVFFFFSWKEAKALPRIYWMLSFATLCSCIDITDLSLFKGWVFPLSMLGIIPLAERLGFATE